MSPGHCSCVRSCLRAAPATPSDDCREWPTRWQELLRNLRSTSGRWHSSRTPCVKRSDGCKSRLQRAPDRAEAHEKLGLAIFLNGDPLTARPYLERACRLDPGSASAHLNLAAIYAELGRFAEARSQALEALRLDPTETRAAGLLKALPK